jgi:NAD(P)-dependent dehydrogenase (short-subunit alcohol dehydrogenase family)
LSPSTPGIRQDLDPEDWPMHRFGLSEGRWGLLDGKSFWITGAGTGYGQAIAFALAAAGGRVFLSGRRAEKLTETRAEIARLGIDAEQCHAVPCDVTDTDSVESAAGTIRESGEALYGLVHCAALPQGGGFPFPLMDMPEDKWAAMLATNLTSALRVSRAALSLTTKDSALRMIFLTSEAGWADTPGFGPYNTTKAGLNSFAMSLAAETAARLPQRDAQINALDPGEARTEMNQGSTNSPFAAVPMALLLLSHPKGGPNGKFFHRDGRHLEFAHAIAHDESLKKE